jgi:hypothetical protein
MTLTNTKVPANQTDYPVLIDSRVTTIPANFWTTVADANGLDIRVWNESEDTELKREIVYFDSASQKLEMFVKIPSLSSSVNTVIWVYCGDATKAKSNDEATWNDNFEMVQHFQGNLIDSTNHNLNGTLQGGATYNASSKLTGSCLDLTAGNDYCDGFGQAGLGSSTEATLMALIKVNNYPGANYPLYIRIGEGGLQAGRDILCCFVHNAANSNKITGFTCEPYSAPRLGALDSAAFGPATWHLVHYTVDDGADTNSIYKNGAVVGIDNSNSSPSGVQIANMGAYIIELGRDSDLATYVDGYIDEVRILSKELNANWIQIDQNLFDNPDSCWTGSDWQAAEYPTVAVPVIFNTYRQMRG